MSDEHLRAEQVLESVSDSFFAVDREWRYTYLNGRAVDQLNASSGVQLTARELLGRSCWELLPEWAEATMLDAFAQAVPEQRTSQHEVYLARTGTWLEVRLSPSAEGLACQHRDITDRKRGSEHQATRKLETAAREQAMLTDLSMRALVSDRMQVLLNDSARLVASVLDVPLSSIGEIGPDRRQLRWRAAFGWSREAVPTAPFSGAGTRSLVGYTVMVMRPVVSEDIASDERFVISAAFAEERPVSAAAVVIPGRRGPFGALVVASREHRRFDHDEIQFMQAVANLVGVAIERAKAEQQLEAAREAERTRIARELHDEALRELGDAVAIAALARSKPTAAHDAAHWSAMTATLQRLAGNCAARSTTCG